MRKQFIMGGDHEIDYTSGPGLYIDGDGDEFNEMPGVVIHDAPWASVVVEVDGGYMAFESEADYETWKNQI